MICIWLAECPLKLRVVVKSMSVSFPPVSAEGCVFRVGQSKLYRKYGDFLAKNTVSKSYARLNVWSWPTLRMCLPVSLFARFCAWASYTVILSGTFLYIITIWQSKRDNHFSQRRYALHAPVTFISCFPTMSLVTNFIRLA